MGDWSTGISSNDTYLEVYDAFFDYYNTDWAIADIKTQLKKDFRETLEIDQDNYWFALANALWECGALDTVILRKVNVKRNLRVWRELGASEQLLKKRKAALDKFVEKLSSQPTKIKKRKSPRKRLVKTIFNKGDCLSFKFKSGAYGGVIVFECDEEGQNFIAATTIHKRSKPSLKDFENAGILSIWDAMVYDDEEEMLEKEEFIAYWFEAASYKDYAACFQQVGNIKVTRRFSHHFLGYFRGWTSWDVLIVFSELTRQRIASGRKQRKVASVKKWLNN